MTVAFLMVRFIRSTWPLIHGWRDLVSRCFDIEIGAGQLERMAAKRHFVLAHGVDLFSRPAITSGIREVGSIFGQHGVDLVRCDHCQGAEKVPGDPSCCLLNQLGKREFGCSVNGYEEIEPPLCGLYLGDIDMEKSDRIGLELLLRWFVAVDIRQAADAMALQAAMQGRPCQVRDRGCRA